MVISPLTQLDFGEFSLFPLVDLNPSRVSGHIVDGQIIATSHDLTPNGGLVREINLFQGNLGW